MRSILGLVLLFACVTVAGPAMAQTPADYEAVRNHVTCYPFGIDRIGLGDLDGGKAIWNDCFTPDFQFSLFFGRGEPLTCPGAKCPLPASMNSVDMRAAVAKKAFESAGFEEDVAPPYQREGLLRVGRSRDRKYLRAGLALEGGWHRRPGGRDLGPQRGAGG